MEGICSQCKKVFKLNLNQQKRKLQGDNELIFCSKQCSGLYYANKQHKKETKQQKLNKNKKISTTLKGKNKVEPIIYNCSYCGKEFELSKSQRKKYKEGITNLCCGIQCSNKLIALKKRGKTYNNSLSSQIIKFNCSYCGKEFELSNNQKQKYIKNNDVKLYCCTSCRNKAISKNNTKQKPTIFKKCSECGKEFELSKDQYYKYLKDNGVDFYCSKSCSMKHINKFIDFNKRSEITQQLYQNKEWSTNRLQKIKNTNLHKYGVENVYQSKEIKDKIKQIKLNKYGDMYYTNREKFKETYKNMSQDKKDIWHRKISKNMKQTLGNRTEQRWTNIKRKLSEAQKRVWESMTLKEKLQYCNALSKGQITRWENMTEEQKQQIIQKTMSNTNIRNRVISKINKEAAEFFNINIFEKQLGQYSYDLFKQPNTLIEINPTYTHNTLQGTWYGAKPKNKNYHYTKTQYARENKYNCINVFDWDDWEKIKYLLQDKETLYARKLEIKEVDKKECNEFLNNYHLQNSCNGQEIRLGLYKDNELIEIMTFGKPRYNKNYEWELLRLCTKPEYKVVGGAEKLFKHFIELVNPKSIISYCDNSKFSGEVYTRLGFTQKGKPSPSSHWSKGSEHITDNLLRQRGFDQLFNTNYGKGTSNEELMIEHGWLPIYDCGQMTFIWNK